MSQTATTIDLFSKPTIDWISCLKSNENKTLKLIYKKYRSKCTTLIQNKYHISEEESKEIFQLSIIILYDKIISSKLTELHSDLKNYILGIAHNKVYELYRRKKRDQKLKNVSLIQSFLLTESEESEELERLITKLNRALNKIGDPCRHILHLFYYNKYSLADITNLLKYKNVNTTKNLKYKCVQRLKKEIDY